MDVGLAMVAGLRRFPCIQVYKKMYVCMHVYVLMGADASHYHHV